LKIGNDQVNSLVDTTLDIHWICTSGNVLQTFSNDRLGQNCCGGSSITSNICCFGSHFLNHLSTHVFDGIFQFDLFGNGYTVFGNGRSTEFLFDNYVTSFGTKGHFHCISQCINALFHFVTGIKIEKYLLSHKCYFKIGD